MGVTRTVTNRVMRIKDYVARPDSRKGEGWERLIIGAEDDASGFRGSRQGVALERRGVGPHRGMAGVLTAALGVARFGAERKGGMDSYARWTRRIAETLSVALFAALLLLQSLNIFLRYTKIGPPLMWVEELTRYGFIWIVFLVWHLSDRSDSHYRADLLSDSLPPVWRRGLLAGQSLLTLGFAILTIWSSFRYIPATLSYSTHSFPWLPMGVVYLVVPIGLTLVAIEQCRRLGGLSRAAKKGGEA